VTTITALLTNKGLVRRVQRVHGVAQGLDSIETRRALEPAHIETQPKKVAFGRLDRLDERRD
jgi:hypothetical protein